MSNYEYVYSNKLGYYVLKSELVSTFGDKDDDSIENSQSRKNRYGTYSQSYRGDPNRRSSYR